VRRLNFGGSWPATVRRFTLDDIVEAYRTIDADTAGGKIVVLA
jgi:hypothetical protein